VDCTGEKLAQETKDCCISMVKKRAVEKHSCDTNFHFDGCIHLTTKKLNDLLDRKIVSNNPVIEILQNKRTYFFVFTK